MKVRWCYVIAGKADLRPAPPHGRFARRMIIETLLQGHRLVACYWELVARVVRFCALLFGSEGIWLHHVRLRVVAWLCRDIVAWMCPPCHHGSF